MTRRSNPRMEWLAMLEGMFRQLTDGTARLSPREVLQGLTAAGLPTYRQALPEIAAELRRCRRYEHPLSVLVTRMDVPPASSTGGARERTLECMLFLLLGSLLRDLVRECDLVTYAADPQCYALVLPETDAAGAERAARRIAHAFHARTGGRMCTTVAEFPGHGLTIDALFDHAMRVLADAPVTPVDVPEPVQETLPCEMAGSAS